MIQQNNQVESTLLDFKDTASEVGKRDKWRQNHISVKDRSSKTIDSFLKIPLQIKHLHPTAHPLVPTPNHVVTYSIGGVNTQVQNINKAEAVR